MTTTPSEAPGAVGRAGGRPTAADWLARVATALGTVGPSAAEMDALLAVAGIAAHASERTAAPLTTWLIGRAGVDPQEAKALATRLAGELEQEEP